MLRTLTLAGLAMAVTGCAPRAHFRPPASTAPPTGYVETEYPAEQLWEGVLDWVARVRGEWEAWPVGRYVAGTVVLATADGDGVGSRSGVPWGGGVGPAYADCGALENEPLAALGTLRATVTVRVRPDPDTNAGLLQVGLLRVWLDDARAGQVAWAFGPPPAGRAPAGPVRCVSTGRFEREAADAILGHATPRRLKP